jgi:N-acylneuraminate cytidylyltransferase
MNKNVAIITARGGSKRIPRKNIKDFLGRPIIAYSIAAALEAGCFAEVMVSTDDEEIADIARSLGAQVPFMRSAENSNDYVGTTEVIREVVLEYRMAGKAFDSLCCIYPTAPFITAAKLLKGMLLLKETGADCVLPVVAFSYPIQRSLKIEDGRAVMFWPENYAKRSQDLIPAYHDSGQFYCAKVTRLLEQMKMFGEHTIPIVVPESEVQDIDNEEDWKIAEMKYRIASGL